MQGNGVNLFDGGTLGLVSVLVHTTGAFTVLYGALYFHYMDFPLSNNEIHDAFGGKFKYLTFLNAIIQAVYFIISLINDFVGTNEVAPRRMPVIRKIKDYMMASLAFPLALNVTISFWSLYAIDRELVLPKILDPVFPPWLNHILHTNIVVFIGLEMFTSFRNYPSRKNGITGLVIFMLCYLVWVHIIKYNSGVWVYPVLEVLQLPQRIIFFIAVLIFTVCLYLFGEFMNNIIWEKELKLAQRKIK